MNTGEVILGIFTVLMVGIVTIVLFAPRSFFEDENDKTNNKKKRG